VQCQPRRERLADEHLRRQGITSFLPLVATTVRHAGRFRAALQPLFPGYLFVDLGSEKIRWRSINGTRGVVRLLTLGDSPSFLPAGIVEEFRAASEIGPSLREGDSVRLRDGPFTGFVGRILRLKPSQRVQVLLEVMSGSVAVEVAPGAVSLLAA
jgi:transcriptional antiterminator RfaH